MSELLNEWLWVVVCIPVATFALGYWLGPRDDRHIDHERMAELIERNRSLRAEVTKLHRIANTSYESVR